MKRWYVVISLNSFDNADLDGDKDKSESINVKLEDVEPQPIIQESLKPQYGITGNYVTWYCRIYLHVQFVSKYSRRMLQ